MKKIILALVLSGMNSACASQFPRVDKDIATYELTVQKMTSEFSVIPEEPSNKIWVKSKLDNMFDIDQYMRKYADTPFKNSYSKEEQAEFQKQFGVRFEAIDVKNTSDLKKLLAIYNWFKISEFGEKTDNQAWLIVQHADKDIEFQKEILVVLEKLWPIGETKPANYAYLFDRVATSPNDQSKKVPQRFGTQGRCVGPSTWQPWEIEDIDQIDQRRKSVGLGTMEEYKTLFKDICH